MTIFISCSVTAALVKSNSHFIEVFTLNDVSVKDNGVPMTLCVMDKGSILDASLAQYAKDLSNSKRLHQLMGAYEHAYSCQLKAAWYELTYLPAIVFNGREVVYGVRSINEALTLREDKHA